MKSIFFTIITCGMVVTTATLAQSTDAVKKADKANDAKAEKAMVNDDDAEFLVKITDGRMMDQKEGSMAVKKSGNALIKEYGQLMVKDQKMLLGKIKTLASDKGITLPSTISNRKEEGREDLANEKVDDFDMKFIKMMKIDHERDVKLFKKALNSTDPQIRAFASEYLPMIEGHLSKIESIKKQLK